MATFNHDKIGVYIMALKDKYHLSDASRNSPGMTVDAELLEARGSALFNTIQLCTAISHGCSADSVRKYLEHYRNDKEEFQEIVDLSTPALYYAIGRNSPELINVLLDYGFNPEGLMNLTYHIIGQLPVLHDMQQRIANQLDSNQESPDPFVMLFAGPPGHGKTELAGQFRDLLCVKHISISCAQIMSDTQLLRSHQGYERSSDGSQLNNPLSHRRSECSVVFLDEFDKTTQEVRDSLLAIMEDRRTNREVDCSKTIWILGDEAIKTYYNRELAHLTDDHKQEADLVPLVDELMDLFKGRWGDAFESRVDKVVPFFPFSLGEQAVVAHKLLLSSAPKVRKDIDYRHEVKRHMSHCHVSFQHDGELCIHLAKKVTLPGLEHAD
ncbi:hypothetical protein J4E83_010748 [Alternaria metachromatica]|uniref:uncharacterized protein n=1 Tax=Alternaria metachromatica TaxID=283354 RepID=UPI0020C582B1|nr:uncharacterized protein J4E83_010748 [Alternaria metachromatica]KAI4605205.1 hypothetical protein J4E83_010748 [Alternaria metachromatica]